MTYSLLAQAEELPSFLKWFGLHHYEFWGIGHHNWVPLLMAWLVGLFLVVVSYLFTRNLSKVPGFSQSIAELLIVRMRKFFGQVLGEHVDRYLPLLGAMFLYILVMNYWPLIPGMHAATARLSTTLALAVVTFFVTHYEGFRASGVDYLKHFVEPIYLAPIMLPIHVVGEIARPVSLAVRLFGNIFGEDTLIATVIILFASVELLLPVIPIPIQFPIYFLTLLAGLIQAIVFTILSAVYIGGAIGAFGEEH